jgi:hypothetical protein
MSTFCRFAAAAHIKWGSLLNAVQKMTASAVTITSTISAMTS